MTVTVALPGATTLASPRAAWVSEGAPMPALDAAGWPEVVVARQRPAVPDSCADGDGSQAFPAATRRRQAGCPRFLPSGGGRARSASLPRAPAVMPVALTGMLRMIEPRELVLGEEFQVAVSLPAAPPDQADRVRYSLYWTSVLDAAGVSRNARPRIAMQSRSRVWLPASMACPPGGRRSTANRRHRPLPHWRRGRFRARRTAALSLRHPR